MIGSRTTPNSLLSSVWQVLGLDAVASLPLAGVIDWESMAVLHSDTSSAGLRALETRLRAIPASVR